MTIHVLHVIDSLKPGGAERQLVNLVRTHDSSRVRSSVVTLFEGSDLATELEGAGVHVERLGLSSPRQLLRGVHRLRRYIADAQPDLVHTRLVYADLIGRVAAALSGRPVVSSVEAPTYDPATRADDAAFRRWKVELVRLADGVTGRLARVTYVPCSENVARSTARALVLPPGRVRVIHNSTIVPNGSAPHARISTLPEEAEVRLLVVGRLSPQKGPDVPAPRPGSGRGALPTGQADGGRTGTARDPAPISTGPLGPRRPRALSRQTAGYPRTSRRFPLFILPSLWEGLSIVALEAMAFGVPIVVSDIPSMRESAIDGVHAALVPPRDVDAFSRSIIEVLDDRGLRERISNSAREQVRTRFDLRVAARRFEQLYEEVAWEGADPRVS
jgi:glycosyltransferase involved in cell wall biosynthesis